ncbi:nucleic acid-binding protein [Serendipita vermifera]|nr:nucleic acid-binding protein [Serendipita vermifera]
MFSAVRSVLPRTSLRTFSTSASRASDVAKVILVGRLGREPEVRTTKSDKEYVSYVVATTNYPPPPPAADGTRPDAGTTWHRILSFSQNQNNYLRSLQRGTRVYVEANLEVREPVAEASPGTPGSMRQVFLRHETLRVLERPRPRSTENGEAQTESQS